MLGGVWTQTTTTTTPVREYPQSDNPYTDARNI
jgi:hypothetical protein